MSAWDGMLTLLALGVGIFALLAIKWTLKHLVIGALYLGEWSCKQEFVGFALYIICWVIALPIMLIVSVVVGYNLESDKT